MVFHVSRSAYFVLVGEYLLGVGPCDPPVVPAVGLHLDVVARNQA